VQRPWSKPGELALGFRRAAQATERLDPSRPPLRREGTASEPLRVLLEDPQCVGESSRVKLRLRAGQYIDFFREVVR
jgi:hypothetical protein